MIEISRIRIDGGTQPRVELDQSTVAEYRDAYKSGAKFPPVTLFFDGAQYWLADGFHRFAGARDAGLTEIYEEIQPGTLREAILYSLSANSRHGLRRSNADKRKAVQTLLDDPEWSQWSQSKIADACGVTREYVNRVLSEASLSCDRSHDSLSCDRSHDRSEKQTIVQRNGTTYAQNTSNIGKQKPSSEPETAPEPEQQDQEYTHLDEAMDTIKDLQDALALANAGDISEEDRNQSAELIARLREENRILTLKLRAVTAARDQYQTENGELKKQIARQRREIDKLAGTHTA